MGAAHVAPMHVVACEPVGRHFFPISEMVNRRRVMGVIVGSADVVPRVAPALPALLGRVHARLLLPPRVGEASWYVR